MKWSELYQTEQELIDEMMMTKSNPEQHHQYELVRGYQYIEAFKSYYKKNGMLTDKQMTQLKRLAPSVYSNIHKNNIQIFSVNQI